MVFSIWRCIDVLGVVSGVLVAGLEYTEFRPEGYSDLPQLGFGRGPDPLHIVQHLTQVKVESDLCEGVNDVLAVTLSAPVVGDITAGYISLLYCPIGNDYSSEYGNWQYWPPHRDECVSVSPACARLQLDAEHKERRTLLLFGQFVDFDGKLNLFSIVDNDINYVTFVVDGKQLPVYGEYTSGQGFGIGFYAQMDQPVLGYGQGPFLADIALLNLTAPLHSAAADPTGCAALHPSATYAVRLLFASAVHERAADGGLAPFGTNGTAGALFSIQTGYAEVLSRERVVGVAAVPGGSVVDVCVEAAAGGPEVEAVVIHCTAGAPLSPGGFPCTTPIKAFLRSSEDEREGRDPATFAAGHTIEFCLDWPENCPGYDTDPPDYSDYSDYRYDGGGDDYSDDAGGHDAPDARSRGGLRSMLIGAGVAIASVSVLAGLGVVGWV